MEGRGNYLQVILEQHLENKLEIKRFFDYLGEIISCTSVQPILSAFLLKWKCPQNPIMEKMMILNYSGTWNPSCLVGKALAIQKPWPEYKRKYSYSDDYVVVTREELQRFKPLNFNELLQLTFWKELYELFGHQILQHIFEKSALLIEVEVGLSLILTYSEGMIHKKIEMGTSRKRSYRNGHISIEDVTAHSFNPYELEKKSIIQQTALPLLTDGKENSEPLFGSGSDKSLFEKSEEFNFEPALKRPKTDELNRINNVGLNDIAKQEAALRWIVPKLDVLNKIKEMRADICQSHGIPCSNVPKNLNKCELNFVLIQPDSEFKPANKCFIIKQNGSISIQKPKLPISWKGIILPKNLEEIAGNLKSIPVFVYNISETLAKSLDIRIKRKPRQKKNISQGIRNISSVHSSCKSPEQNAPLSNSKNILQQHVNTFNIAGTGTGTNTDNIHILNMLIGVKPYAPNLSLSISFSLYNKSAWSKWPSSHVLSQVIRNSHNKSAALTTLLDSILKSPTCSLPTTVELHLKKCLTPNDSEQFTILWNMIQSHKRFKDVHKLVKNCLKYWRMKHVNKLNKRVNNKVSNTQRILPLIMINPQSKENCDIIRLNDNVVDLITPISTSSAHSSPKVEETVRNYSLSAVTSTSISPNTSMPLLKQIAKNSKSMNDSKTKDTLRKCSETTGPKKRTFHSLRHVVPHNCLMQTLKHVLYILKVDMLLGSKRNIRGFFKFVRKSIILGGRKSCLQFGELMAHLYPEDVSTVPDFASSSILKEIFVAKLVFWLFNNYILVLLRTSFYATESSSSRQQLNFYLRESWTSASTKMRTRLVKKSVLQQKSSSSGGTPTSKPNSILRFIPKQNHSLRSLLIKKNSALRLKSEDLNNFKLVLYYIDASINKSRLYIPLSIQLAWRKFLLEWKSTNCPKLYYLRVDIRDAFPSVSFEKLGEILVNCGPGGKNQSRNTILKQYLLLGPNNRKLQRNSIFDEQCPNNWYSGILTRPCIIMDKEKDKPINSHKMLKHLLSVVTKPNIVRVGKKTFDFSFGLPQGWNFSPILCSIYYGYIDNKHYLPHVQSGGRFFLRVTDDYLFVTPNPKEVLKLTRLMSLQCSILGYKLNEDKFETNVFVRSDLAESTSTCEHVLLCGWNFCMTCAHVSRDFKKYQGQNFCSTISFSYPLNAISPEEFIISRGTMIMCARLNPILLDPTINCAKRIILNTFEASIILGFRFYAICRVVYPSLNALKEPKRAKVLNYAINICCNRLARYVIRRYEIVMEAPFDSSNYNVLCNGHCCGCGDLPTFKNKETPILSTSYTLDLTYDVLLVTALTGFRLKLENHHGVFKNLILPKLKSRIKSVQRRFDSQTSDNIVKFLSTKMPECFATIRT